MKGTVQRYLSSAAVVDWGNGWYVRVLSGNELFEGGDVSVPLFKHSYSTMLTGRQQFYY